MARHKGKVELRVSQLREFAEKLRAVADTCDSNCDLATAKGIETLAVTHFPTGEDGIESISKFVGAVYSAASEALLKQTLQAAEPRASYTTKKASPKKPGKD
jgi:hypothetical protein